MEKSKLFKILFLPKAFLLTMIFKSKFSNISHKELFKKILNFDNEVISIIKSEIKKRPYLYAQLFVMVDAFTMYILIYAFKKIISKITSTKTFKDKIYELRRKILDKLEELRVSDPKNIIDKVTLFDDKLKHKVKNPDGSEAISYPSLKMGENLDVKVLVMLFKLLDDAPKTNIPAILYVFIVGIVKTIVYSSGLFVADIFSIRSQYIGLFIGNVVGYFLVIEYRRKQYIKELSELCKNSLDFKIVKGIENIINNPLNQKYTIENFHRFIVERMLDLSTSNEKIPFLGIPKPNDNEDIPISRIDKIYNNISDPVHIYVIDLFKNYMDKKLKEYGKKGSIKFKDLKNIASDFIKDKNVRSKLSSIENYSLLKSDKLKDVPESVKSHIDKYSEKLIRHYIETLKNNNKIPKDVKYDIYTVKKLIMNKPKPITEKDIEKFEKYIETYYGKLFGVKIDKFDKNDMEMLSSVLSTVEMENTSYNRLSKFRGIISAIAYLIISFINKTKLSTFMKLVLSSGVKIVDELINMIVSLNKKYDIVSGINYFTLSRN